MLKLIASALLIMSFVFPLTASAKAPQPGIGSEWVIGGVLANPAEPINKSIVSLGFCTATLVGERTVLTAAHCLDMEKPFKNGVVYAAGLTSGQPCAKTRVKEVAVSPGATYNPTKGFYYPDVVLLLLESPLCGAVPARLGERPVVTGDEIFSAGYGRGSVSKEIPTRVSLRAISKTDDTLEKLYADLAPLIPNLESNLRGIRRNGFSNYNAAVAITPGESMCPGDSGGPTYRDPHNGSGVVELVGVNGAIIGHELRGREECEYGFLQLYTPVAPFIPWIRLQSNEWNARL
jgi:secreted trypsin-like serine protease